MAIIKGAKNEIEVFCTPIITYDLGKTEKLRFKVRFRRHTETMFQEKVAAMVDKQITAAGLIREDILGWRELKGEDGDVDFCEEALGVLLNEPEYLAALLDAWNVAQRGSAMARAKN
jgi:hypothetical protein